MDTRLNAEPFVSARCEESQPFAKRLLDSVFSLQFATLALGGALVYTFDEWRLAYLGAGIAAALVFMMPPLARYASLAARCVLPLLLGRACVELYVAVQTKPFFSGVTQYLTLDNFYKEPFYTSVSTLYAIITALALIKSIEDFGCIKNNLANEAQKIQAIIDLTKYFDREKDIKTKMAVNTLRECLSVYASNVAHLRDTASNTVNVGLLDKCQEAIAEIDTFNEKGRYALRKLIDERSELAALRQKRITSVGDSTPGYLVVALWLVAMALILPFFAAPLIDPADTAHIAANPTRYTQYYMIFLMASLNSYLLLMLSDINNCFDGFWMVDMKSFEELSKYPLETEHIQPSGNGK